MLTRLLAVVFLVCGVGAAVVIHRHMHMEPCGLGFDRPVCAVRDRWEDPIASGVGVTGVLVAGAVVYRDLRTGLASSSAGRLEASQRQASFRNTGPAERGARISKS
jgi:hypothetical protein